jgi:hypothetical protein
VQRAAAEAVRRCDDWMQQVSGALHYQLLKRRLSAADRAFEYAMASTSSQPSGFLGARAHEKRRWKARLAFEMFDGDSSGAVGAEALRGMLKELCIPLTSAQVEALASHLDTDGSGDVGLEALFAWYDEEESTSRSSVSAFLRRQCLLVRRFALQSLGMLMRKRAKGTLYERFARADTRSAAVCARPRLSCLHPAKHLHRRCIARRKDAPCSSAVDAGKPLLAFEASASTHS